MTDLVEAYSFFCPFVNELETQLNGALKNYNENQFTTNLPWSSSLNTEFDVAPIILVHHFGDTELYAKTEEFINEQLREKNVAVGNMVFHVMTPYSRIDWHNDGDEKGGRVGSLTIYLNQKWGVDKGGELLYNIDNKLERETPVYNKAVYMDGSVKHCVTPVYDNTIRKSLQVWLKRIGD